MPLAEITRRGIGQLPQNLGEALDAMEADAVITGALGPTLTAEFLALKRQEHLSHARHVSDWELERYASAF